MLLLLASGSLPPCRRRCRRSAGSRLSPPRRTTATLGDQPFFLALRLFWWRAPRIWRPGHRRAVVRRGSLRAATSRHLSSALWHDESFHSLVSPSREHPTPFCARARSCAIFTHSLHALSLCAPRPSHPTTARFLLFLSSTQVVTRVAPNHFFGSYALSARIGSSIDHLWRRGGVGSLTPPARGPTAGGQTFWRHWLLYLLSSTLVLESWVSVLGSSERFLGFIPRGGGNRNCFF